MQVISTPVFQRLRNVKQLGLAYSAFPGADYSRFSHSIGVCHITGLILENLIRVGIEIDKKEIQLYRLAGLMHDIGHYPFSHAMEHAIADFYLRGVGEGKEPVKFYKHESVSKATLENNSQIQAVLKAADLSPEDIYKVFNREQPPRFANLISSDLDADRIDYLMRTAHHTGLPYGTVDLGYLLSQLRLDKNERICFTAKALRTAEHLLLGRYFDYQQVAFHKTVAGMEWLLQDLLCALLEEKEIEGSASWVNAAIKNGEWDMFDDTYVTNKIRDLAKKHGNKSVIGNKAKALIERRPPKLVIEMENMQAENDQSRKNYSNELTLLKNHLPNLISEFGIAADYWTIWKPGIRTLTKIGSRIPVSSAEDTKDKYEQAVRIIDDQGSSAAIMEKSSSLMSILSNYALYTFRLYVLLPEDNSVDIDAIRQSIKKALPDLTLK